MPEKSNLEELKDKYNEYLKNFEIFAEKLKDENILELIKEMKGGVVNEDMMKVLEKCDERLQDEYTEKNREDLEKQLNIKNAEVKKITEEIKDLDWQIDNLVKKRKTMWGRIWDFFTKRISKDINEKKQLKERKRDQEGLGAIEVYRRQERLEDYESAVRVSKKCINILKNNVKEQVEEMQKKDEIVNDIDEDDIKYLKDNVKQKLSEMPKKDEVINGIVALQYVDELPKGKVYIKDDKARIELDDKNRPLDREEM